MKKSITISESELVGLIKNLIKEIQNPFTLPGSGTGPNWLTQQANWQN